MKRNILKKEAPLGKTMSSDTPIINRIYGIIEKEGHSHFKKTGKDMKDYDDIPENYDTIVQIMTKFNGTDGDVFNYARALYSTYYQETQALVSQAWPNILQRSKEEPKEQLPPMSDNDYFTYLLHTSDPYLTFIGNLKVCGRIRMNPINLTNLIAMTFKHNGDDSVTPDYILKSLDRIEEKSEDALRDATNNAYIYWTKYREELQEQ